MSYDRRRIANAVLVGFLPCVLFVGWLIPETDAGRRAREEKEASARRTAALHAQIKREREERAEAARARRAEQEAAVSMKVLSWRLGGFGTVAIGTFALRNNNTVPIKDISIACDFFAESGTHLSNTFASVSDVVPARSTKTVRDFTLGQVHPQVGSMSCRLAGLHPVE